MTIPAIVAAGDLRAAKAIHGESKAYLEVDSRPLVLHAVRLLQGVPEVSEVWVVGNTERLEEVCDAGGRASRAKPLHVVPQFRNLFENGWETYRRRLSDAPPDGRDPRPEERGAPVLLFSMPWGIESACHSTSPFLASSATTRPSISTVKMRPSS